MSNIDKSDLPAFKRACNKAIKEGKASFMFSGNEVLVSYAQYIIEYLTHTKHTIIL